MDKDFFDEYTKFTPNCKIYADQGFRGIIGYEFYVVRTLGGCACKRIIKSLCFYQKGDNIDDYVVGSTLTPTQCYRLVKRLPK